MRVRCHRRWRQVTRSSDDGFSIVEAVLAMGIAVFLVAALTSALTAGLTATSRGKRYQQATALGNAAVEAARELDYGELAMLMSGLDPIGDSRITSTCPGLSGTHFVDPDGTGPLRCEEIHSVAANAGVHPYTTTELVSGLVFTVRRYVTWVDQDSQGDTGKDYKRIVAIVEWNNGPEKGMYHASTLVTAARRGTNVASFDLTPTPKAAEGSAEQAKKVQRGFRVVFAHSIKNLGRADTYELSHVDGPQSPARSWTITFHRDLNSNREFDAASEQTATLTNTGGAATPDTGRVITGATFPFLSVWTLNASEPVGTEYTQLTARSTLDPEFTETRTDKLEITDRPIDLVLRLHNRPSPPTASTIAQIDLAMDSAKSTTTQLFNYSTDISAARPGRVVQLANSGATETDKRRMVNWLHPAPSRLTLKGDARLDIFLINTDLSCFVGGVFNVHLRDRPLSGSTGTTTISTASSTTAPLSCPARQVSIPIASETMIDIGRHIELKLTAPTSGNVVDIAFAYDTTSYDAVLTLPQTTAVVAP